MAVKKRTSIDTAYNSFIREIERLEKFDHSNQIKFTNRQLTKPQIELLVEAIFFAGFRSYEAFIREIFLLYCQEKQPSRGRRVKSYLKPRNFAHTESLIKSSMRILEWNSPDEMIERADLYLRNGHPIKLPYTSNLQQLKEFRHLRNHIAHNSVESESQFAKVVNRYYNGVRPLRLPSAGEYLMLSSKQRNGNYILLDFFNFMKNISSDIT